MPKLSTQNPWNPSLTEPRYSQSLERGLSILRHFTAERPVLGLSEIADELGMTRSTTHRYAVTLVALGYLDRAPAQKYRLATAVIDLGMAALNGMTLKGHAHPLLEECRDLTGCTVSLAVRDGETVLIVDTIASLRRERAGDARQTRQPAHCTAPGKVLLAHLEDERAKALRAMTLTKCGPRTITGKRALVTELEDVLDHGLAIDNEESGAGALAMAVPVRDADGVIAALSVTAQGAIDETAFIQDVALHAHATAARISARVGYYREVVPT